MVFKPAKFKFLSKNKISRLPKNSGVYAFKKGGEFLYVGKAADLKERIKNHFSQSGFKDNIFLNETNKIGFLKTDSEIEALILEANLIKKYQPKYNVLWRDDKNYFYVGITKEEFPRLFITHQPAQKLKIAYLGPFVDGSALKQTLKILRKVFPYRTCKKLPRHPCLAYQLRRCPAPCLLKSKLGQELPSAQVKMKRECQKNTKNLIKILQGKKKDVLRSLKKEMMKLAKNQDFERAAKIRDQIGALEKSISNTRILPSPEIESWEQIEKELKNILNIKKGIERIEAYDISNIQGKLATGSMVTFVKGKPDKNYYRHFKVKKSSKPNDIAMIKEILSRRIRHREWKFPDLVLIDGGRAQLNAAKLTINKKLPIIALAKKRNQLYTENNTKPLNLESFPEQLKFLILRIRDEAHRFALSYHRKLRRKELI